MYLESTPRFAVLTSSKPKQQDDAPSKDEPTSRGEDKAMKIPTLELSRLLSSSKISNEEDGKLRLELLDMLREYGFVVLTVPRNSAPAGIIGDLKDSLTNKFFVGHDDASPQLSFTGTGDVYISEKGIPMWKTGYELCEDGVREAFRVAAGSPDDGPWPSNAARETWLKGVALCRHICDCALKLTVDATSDNTPNMRVRPGSGGASWKKTDYCQTPVGQMADRRGDYSVLYAMHYFNQTDTPFMDQDGDVRISVKQHVDPSLFVLEPFLADQPGLQVFSQGEWVTCDGPKSPIHGVLDDDQMGMVLFVGKAFSKTVARDGNNVQPTLHRVITAGRRRTTMIYEQKYEEFFPPPILD
jgi:hypothetical protein